MLILVEDDRALRRSLTQLLGDFGFVVCSFETGHDALDAFAGHDSGPDLLVTDVEMPAMKGTELARCMIERWPRLPVVFMSGRPEYGHLAQEARSYFLAKPFVPTDLARLAREISDRPRRPVKSGNAKELGRRSTRLPVREGCVEES